MHTQCISKHLVKNNIENNDGLIEMVIAFSNKITTQSSANGSNIPSNVFDDDERMQTADISKNINNTFLGCI